MSADVVRGRSGVPDAGVPEDAEWLWESRTYPELEAELSTGRLVAIVPVGSTEAHGPHLPLATDVLISRGMAIAAARRLRLEHAVPALVLPAVAYSVTDFSSDFAGTISVRSSTASALLEDLGRGVLAQGAAVIVYANAHLEPEHISTIRTACERLERDYPGRTAFPDKTRKPWALELGAEFRSGACHAGEYEGSLVLATRPQWVRSTLASGLPENWSSLSDAIRAGLHTFRAAGGPRAYFGAPAKATAQTGASLLEVLSRMLASAALDRLNALPTSGPPSS